jgi:hypothetical protein
MAKSSPPRVLLFDDDDSAMRGLQEHLTKQLGWRVDLAADWLGVSPPPASGRVQQPPWDPPRCAGDHPLGDHGTLDRE